MPPFERNSKSCSASSAAACASAVFLGIWLLSQRLLARSPFVRHLQEWPRGYAGDWQIVEQLVSATNRSEPGTCAWYFEESALHSAAPS